MKTSSSVFQITVRRPVAILMIVIAVFVFGTVSYKMLALNLMPDITYPTVTVRTEFEGAAPEEVENNISRRLEQALAVVNNLSSISSISRAGISDVILEFQWGTDVNDAIQDIREKLDQVFLPDEAKKPVILRYDPTLDPIVTFGVSSDKENLMFLRNYCEDHVKIQLDKIPGVAAVKVRGGLEEEIHVDIDEKKLISLNLDINRINQRLANENVNLAGGKLKEGSTEYIVRTVNQFENLTEMQNLIIGTFNGVDVRITDIGTVTRNYKDREVVSRINENECVMLEIYKEADANIVSVAESVKRQLLKEKKPVSAEGQTPDTSSAPAVKSTIADSMPGHMEVSLLADQSTFIKNSINEVKSNAKTGGLLAILILYLFLRNLKSTVIVSVTIPLSIITTFAFMNFFDVSLNIMSLGGIALGVGMLVDNAIVVLESIFRCQEEGDDIGEGTVRGTHEVGTAVVASTLTTVAVFFPIIFVEGIAGQIFKDMSLTVVFALMSSLMFALFFIPMLASRTFKKGGPSSFKKMEFFFGKISFRNIVEDIIERKPVKKFKDDSRITFSYLKFTGSDKGVIFFFLDLISYLFSIVLIVPLLLLSLIKFVFYVITKIFKYFGKITIVEPKKITQGAIKRNAFAKFGEIVGNIFEYVIVKDFKEKSLVSKVIFALFFIVKFILFLIPLSVLICVLLFALMIELIIILFMSLWFLTQLSFTNFKADIKKSAVSIILMPVFLLKLIISIFLEIFIKFFIFLNFKFLQNSYIEFKNSLNRMSENLLNIEVKETGAFSKFLNLLWDNIKLGASILVLIFIILRLILFSLATIAGKIGMFFFALILGIVWVSSKVWMFLHKYVLDYILRGFNAAFSKLQDGIYPKVISVSLNNKRLIMLLVLAAFYVTFISMKNLDSELIPTMHQGEFSVIVAFPVGTPIEKTDEFLRPYEEKMMKIEGVETFFVRIGVEKDSYAKSNEGEYSARIGVKLSKSKNILAAEERVISEIRDIFKNLPDADVKIEYPALFTFKAPVEIEVRGYNLQKLKEYSYKALEELKSIPDLKDIEVNIRPGNPEIQIVFNRDALARLNLDLVNVSELVRNQLLGNVATKFIKGDKRIGIRVKIEDNTRKTLEDLNHIVVNPGQTINGEAQKPIPLSAVADLEVREGPSEIRRIDQQRVGLVTANLSGFGLKEVTEKIRQKLAKINNPLDIEYVIAGQNQEMEKSSNSMIFALLLSVFLVYIVMASQFESLLHPFVIMFTIPLALFGVGITLYAMDIPLSVIVFIGMMMLAGIVVNNAIVLVDYINLLKEKGMELRDAIVEAGRVRLRPIIMTTLTTVLGLLPMALGFGEGSEIRKPMAITVISGLIFSTLLTLIVIPTIYELVESWKVRKQK